MLKQESFILKCLIGRHASHLLMSNSHIQTVDDQNDFE